MLMSNGIISAEYVSRKSEVFHIKQNFGMETRWKTHFSPSLKDRNYQLSEICQEV